MSIEEIFNLIRKNLNEFTKEISEEKEQAEFMASFLEKSKIISVRLNEKSYGRNFEFMNIFKKEKRDKYISDYKEKVKEYNQDLELCNSIKLYFGKNQFQKKVINFSALFVVLNLVNDSIDSSIDKDMFAKIFGMAIYNNNKIYERSPKEKNQDLNSSDIVQKKEAQAVLNLKPYFSSDGSVIANENVNLFIDSIFELFALYFDFCESEMSQKKCGFSAILLIKQMKEQLLAANSAKLNSLESCSNNTNVMLSKKQRRDLIEQLRINEQELAKYFDGEKILIPCNSIEEFSDLVKSCNLSEEDKNRIISKMKTFLDRNKALNNILFLTLEEQKVYKAAIEKQIGNVQIKAYLEEINLLLEMYKETLSIEDKKYIENEVRILIKSLGFLLNIKPMSLNLQN